jgi:hypothetical protein
MKMPFRTSWLGKVRCLRRRDSQSIILLATWFSAFGPEAEAAI